MHIDDLAALLKRYHQDQCTPEERRIIEEWYDGLSSSESVPDEATIAASLEKVLGRMDKRVGKQPARWPWLAAAAAVVLAAGIYMLKRPATKPVDATITVSTLAAEIRTLTLPDGSTVTLNASSTLSYKRDFADRQVHLDGEAHFQIAPDPGRPFVAEARGVRTTVLGTSFDIRAYTRDTVVAVALLMGKVRVGDSTLEPGDIAYNGTSGIRMGHIDSDITAWEQKAITFRDASFEDIAFALQNTYNVRLVNASGKRHWSYTGYFKHESVREIIRTICITEHLDYRSDQGQIILVNKN